MQGGEIIDNDGYHLNIDSIMKVKNTTYYISGNVIPELITENCENKNKIINIIADLMKDRNISIIVDISNYNHKFPKSLELKKHNIVHINYNINDRSMSLTNNSIYPFIKSLIKTIISAILNIQCHLITNKNAGNVLIHCYMGQNRSQLIFIAFMMLVYDYSYYFIRLELIKNRGKFIISNPLFISLLYHISINKNKYHKLMNSKTLDLDLDMFVKEIIQFMFNNKSEILHAESIIHKQYLRFIIDKSYNKNLNRLDKLLTVSKS